MAVAYVGVSVLLTKECLKDIDSYRDYCCRSLNNSPYVDLARKEKIAELMALSDEELMPRYEEAKRLFAEQGSRFS